MSQQNRQQPPKKGENKWWIKPSNF
jgi:hypothetical protein